MRLSIIIMMFLVSSNINSQEIKTFYDEFTNVSETHTSTEKFSDGFPLKIKYYSGTPPYTFDIAYNSGDICYTILEDSDFFLKLSNGENINLKVSSTNICNYNNVGTISYFLNQFECDFSVSQLKLLQGNYIEKVRFYTTDGYIEKNVKKRKAKKLRKLFNIVPHL